MLGFYDLEMDNDGTVKLVKECEKEWDKKINNPCDATKIIQELTGIHKKAEEHCYMVAVNRKNVPIGIFFLSKGTGCNSLIGRREVFMRALLIGAYGIIVFHNHPSFDCYPSASDVQVKEAVRQAGELIGIPLQDFVIVGGDNSFSMKEHEMMN